MKRFLDWSPIVLGLLFLALLSYFRHNDWMRGKNDFVTFYAGAKLAGTANLYSRTANLALNQSLVGSTMDMMYIRPPFYAALLKPLAFFPYVVAYTLFSAASLASILWFVIRFSKECSALPFFAAMSVPFLATLCAGQDSPFLLPVIGGAMLLSRRGRDFAAGLLLSLCAIKFHLFLLVPVVFLVKRRSRILGGNACGVILLVALGALVNGPRAYVDWVNVLRDPWINPYAAGMPNLHGLVADLGGGAWVEASIAAIVVLVFLWMMLKIANDELALAASLVCGLLLSFHSTMADDVLLFPVLLLVFRSSLFVPLRVLAGLILTPVPYFMLLAGEPYSAILPIALVLLVAAMIYSVLTAQAVPARPLERESAQALP